MKNGPEPIFFMSYQHKLMFQIFFHFGTASFPWTGTMLYEEKNTYQTFSKLIILPNKIFWLRLGW